MLIALMKGFLNVQCLLD